MRQYVDGLVAPMPKQDVAGMGGRDKEQGGKCKMEAHDRMG